MRGKTENQGDGMTREELKAKWKQIEYENQRIFAYEMQRLSDQKRQAENNNQERIKAIVLEKAKEFRRLFPSV